MNFLKYALSVLLLGLSFFAFSQNKRIQVTVFDEQQLPVPNATVQLFLAENEALIKTDITDKGGKVYFNEPIKGNYTFKVVALGFTASKTTPIKSPFQQDSLTIRLVSGSKNLGDVTIAGKKQLIQRTQGKTIVNVDAAVTNAGTTVLEVLEKSPGVMVDRKRGHQLTGEI